MAAIYIKRILKTAIILLSIFYLLSLLWLFSRRLMYPFELDWIEGGMLTSVIQILDGHHLYTEPSISYVPFIYPPVFFYLSAFTAKIAGGSLLSLRLVSVIASFISLVMIVLIVFGETKSWFWGAVSASLFAGLYPLTRFWFDLARVDSVFLMFFLLFLFSIRRENSTNWQIAAGIFASLTILTKQNGLTMCLPVMAAYSIFDWRHRLALPITFALVFGSISLAFMVSSGGWYTYYCYVLVFSQPNNLLMYSFLDFIQGFILSSISVAALLALFVFPFWFSRGPKERLVLWLIVFATTILTSYAAKSNVGGVNNVVIPTFALFSLLFGIGASEISKMFQASSIWHSTIVEICCCLLVLFQLGSIIYNPLLYAPSLDDDRNAFRALKLVKKFDGNVYLPNSSILLIAGKKTFAHPSAIWDILKSRGESRAKDILQVEFQKAMDAQLFDAIVMLPPFEYFPSLQKHYILDASKYILIDADWHEKASIYVLPSNKNQP